MSYLKPIFTILLTFFGLLSIGQTKFHKTYGGQQNDNAFTVIQTSNGDYLIAGETYSFGMTNHTIYVLKVNQSGDTIWTKILGDLPGRAISVIETSDGGYVVAAAYSLDILILKLSSSGDLLWSNRIGQNFYSEFLGSVIQTADGGYALIGETESIGSGNFDMYLIKTNSAGNVLWTKTYGSAKYEFGSSIQQTPDGGYIISGTTSDTSLGPYGNLYLIRTDNTGDTLWTKIYKNTNLVGDDSKILSIPGGYFIFGQSGAIFLIKTDLNGNIVWAKTYTDTNKLSFYARNIFKTADGDFMMLCNLGGGSYGFDIYLLKIDGNGDIVWAKQYPGAGVSSSSSTSGAGQQTSDGGYLIAGAINIIGSGQLEDISLIKADSTGNSICPTNNPSISVSSIGFQSINRVTNLSSGVTVVSPTLTIMSGAKTGAPCPLEIHETSIKNELEIFPNPFENKIIIRGTKSGGVIIIVDIFGQEIIKTPTSNNVTIVNLEMLASQLYFLNYISNHGQIQYRIFKE